MTEESKSTKVRKILAVPIAELNNEDWYQVLMEELSAIKVETQFCVAEDLIKGKWLLGNTILENEELVKREKIYGKRIIEKIAEDLKISVSDVWRSIQFAKKFPSLVNEEKELSLKPFEEGKNISWRKIIQNYLPAPNKERSAPCDHFDIDRVTFCRCQKCKEHFGGKTELLTQKERLNLLDSLDEKQKHES